MCKKVKIIDAPLCSPCAELLGQTVSVTPEKASDGNTVCPWCERSRAAAIYRLEIDT